MAEEAPSNKDKIFNLWKLTGMLKVINSQYAEIILAFLNSKLKKTTYNYANIQYF